MARAAKSAGGAGVRVFPAQPPEPGRRGFGATWWGREWVTALEQTSMDSGRLSRGRSYARAGAVGEITVKPGRLTAKVRGSAPRPYSSGIRLGILTDAEWDRLLDVVAAKALHIAALLDRDMPQGLVDDAAAAGVHLLPHGSELEPSCSCPDWGYPCKHAAALCYQIARIMDEDPFVLLLMRGRDEPAIMAELHRRNTVRAAVERSADDQHEHEAAAVPSPRRPKQGTPAREAFAAWPAVAAAADPPPLPDPVAETGEPAVLDASEPAPGVDPSALELLAADAAARAKALLDAYLSAAPEPELAPEREPDRDIPPLIPALDPRRDAVRLLAGRHHDVDVFARLVAVSGAEPMQMARGIRAWRHGGPAGLDVLEEPWTPPADDLARARALIAAGWEGEDPPTAKIWRNRWTFAGHGVQLRYGRDGRWYPYLHRDGDWFPSGPPSSDPLTLLTELLDQSPDRPDPEPAPRRASSRSR